MNHYETKVDGDLLLSFFLLFSRFEYALKASGYFKRPNEIRYDPGRPPNAEPDWDSFAVSLRALFVREKEQDLTGACDYLLAFPPNRQVILRDASGFTVAWETPVRPYNEMDIEFMLRMVRNIRNNLFHGGKYGTGIHENVERTERLIISSLRVLEECLKLAPEVRKCFEEAVL
jgi:hypothetical protein